MINDFIICLFFGSFSGLLAGLFGIGGGIVLVPFFIALFSAQNFPAPFIMLMAVATSLATIVVTAISASLAHHKLGELQWSIVLKLTPSIFIGAIIGASIASHLATQHLKILLGLFLIYVGLKMANQRPQIQKNKLSILFFHITGIIIGSLSALLGIGGGTLTVPFLIRQQFSLPHAIAISSSCGLPIALAGTISYALLGWQQTNLPEGSLGYIYLPAFFGIIISSLITAPIGAKLAHRLPTQQLKRYFSILLFIAAIKLLA